MFCKRCLRLYSNWIYLPTFHLPSTVIFVASKRRVVSTVNRGIPIKRLGRKARRFLRLIVRINREYTGLFVSSSFCKFLIWQILDRSNLLIRRRRIHGVFNTARRLNRLIWQILTSSRGIRPRRRVFSLFRIPDVFSLFSLCFSFLNVIILHFCVYM